MKKLTLSTNRKLAGVCGGIAEYLDIDPTVLRIIWLIAVPVCGIGILAYFICWLMMPSSSDTLRQE